MTAVVSGIRIGIYIDEFITNKHRQINNKTVANLPLLETLILSPLNITYKDPINTKNSRTNIA